MHVSRTAIVTAFLALLPFAPLTGRALGADAKPAPPVKQEKTAAPAKTDVLAKVNGTPITRVEVDRAVKVLLSQSRIPADKLPDELKKQAEKSALEQLISAELLYQAASKDLPKDLDKEVDERIAQNRKKFPSDELFQKALASADLTEADLRDLTRKDIAISNFIEKKYAAGITITDAEAKKFYDENIDRFKRPEMVRASHILIGVTEKATAEEKEKAKAKAEEVLKEVKAGKDFAELAKKYSTGPSNVKGGDLGFFGRGQMVKPFEDAAFALKPGEVSGVVETQFGYHIIKVTDRKGGDTVKLDDVKEKIKDYLKDSQIKQKVNDFLTGLREKAKIERSEL